MRVLVVDDDDFGTVAVGVIGGGKQPGRLWTGVGSAPLTVCFRFHHP
jgi:hypothetical protein